MLVMAKIARPWSLQWTRSLLRWFLDRQGWGGSLFNYFDRSSKHGFCGENNESGEDLYSCRFWYPWRKFSLFHSGSKLDFPKKTILQKNHSKTKITKVNPQQSKRTWNDGTWRNTTNNHKYIQISTQNQKIKNMLKTLRKTIKHTSTGNRN